LAPGAGRAECLRSVQDTDRKRPHPLSQMQKRNYGKVQNRDTTRLMKNIKKRSFPVSQIPAALKKGNRKTMYQNDEKHEYMFCKQLNNPFYLNKQAV